jgi:hypothetical protein
LNGVERTEVLSRAEPAQELFRGLKVRTRHPHYLELTPPHVGQEAAAEELEIGKSQDTGAHLLGKHRLDFHQRESRNEVP